MRISTQQVFLNNIDNLNKNSSEVFKTQQQLSTGKRVLQPSDDPLASAQIQKFKKEIARSEQFAGNIDVAQRRLALEEETIEQVNNLSIRLRELAIQGKTGTLGTTDRQALASEVGEIVKSLDSLMNTKDVQGEYLFSGNKGFTKPYTLDASTGRYVFNGDDGQRFLQVGPENKVASTDSGFEVFEKIPRVSGYVEADIQQSLNLIGDVDIVGGDAEAFGDFMAANGPLTVTVTGGLLTVTDRKGQPVTADDPAVALNGYNPAANPNAPIYEIAGVEVELNTGADGTATLDVFDQHNILNTAVDLRDALNNYDGSTGEAREQFNQQMDFILDNLAGIEERNVAARSSIGGRQNALEQQDLVNEDYKLFTQEALSSFEDLDYNEAISRFQLQQTVLQASYSSFARVQELNLFNFIN
ncbi:flagellar hook-associated protein FlgL [Neptuniibacter halophilus]|uniref:flagellar hook-associated protein FlgL n=1 Tax=Neptuniibacter halophilus TaxID=651666 RepID=UPI002574293E|nr:flagellar hook-associated protein FlgL [Neptuniibacter halophilus]